MFGCCFFYIILLQSVVTNSHLKFTTTNEQVPSNFSAAFLLWYNGILYGTPQELQL